MSYLVLPINVVNATANRNPRQRAPEDRSDWAQFAASIKAHGVIEPLVVGPKEDDGSYPLRAGWSRLAAAKAAGFKVVPVVVNDSKATEVSLIENLQREDLHWSEMASEVAAALAGKKPRYSSASALAEALNMSAASISNFRKLGESPIGTAALERHVTGKPVCSINQALAALKFSEKSWAEAAAKDEKMASDTEGKAKLTLENFALASDDGVDMAAEFERHYGPKEPKEKGGSSAGWECVGGKALFEYKRELEKALNKGLYNDADANEARVIIQTLRWAIKAIKNPPLAIPSETGAKPATK